MEIWRPRKPGSGLKPCPATGKRCSLKLGTKVYYLNIDGSVDDREVLFIRDIKNAPDYHMRLIPTEATEPNAGGFCVKAVPEGVTPCTLQLSRWMHESYYIKTTDPEVNRQQLARQKNMGRVLTQ